MLAGGAALAAVLVRGWSLVPRPVEPALEVDADAPFLPRPEAAASELRELLHGNTGRVLEVVRYRIDPAEREAFLEVMREVRLVRLRGGAMLWRLYEDVAHPERYAELWAVETWAEHLREHGRLAPADRQVLTRAAAFQEGGQPEASRYLNVLP
jgi:hypothetical protein